MSTKIEFSNSEEFCFVLSTNIKIFCLAEKLFKGHLNYECSVKQITEELLKDKFNEKELLYIKKNKINSIINEEIIKCLIDSFIGYSEEVRPIAFTIINRIMDLK